MKYSDTEQNTSRWESSATVNPEIPVGSKTPGRGIPAERKTLIIARYGTVHKPSRLTLPAELYTNHAHSIPPFGTGAAHMVWPGSEPGRGTRPPFTPGLVCVASRGNCSSGTVCDPAPPHFTRVARTTTRMESAWLAAAVLAIPYSAWPTACDQFAIGPQYGENGGAGHRTGSRLVSYHVARRV